MRYAVPLLALALAAGGQARAAGLLVPDDAKVPPLSMVSHHVTVAIEDQVAVTTVEQSFRNHTARNLEATYLFPVPRGASVDHFTMWVDGKETGGELLDAKKASQVYTEIVRRTNDPGLLEYLGNDLLRLRVFPIPPNGDQKVKVSFKSISQKDAGTIEYIYPLKTDGKSTRTLEGFSVKLTLKSQHPIQNVYSPTHAVDIDRKNDRELEVTFEREQALLDKDFQLFWGTGEGDVGVTPLVYRPVAAEDGYVMMLVSPQTGAEMVRTPRDLVLVLDTSSSMSDLKMQQAKQAVKLCLSQLGPDDRFGVVKFSTTVLRFRDDLVPASKEFVELAGKWVDGLRASGGTAILPALEHALEMRTDDPARPFTVVFFTDGLPTVNETNPDAIVKKVAAENTANTRIFTFGVGDDVNAAMLDQLADETRAVSTYVRPAEDIKAKAESLYAKISHPVMTDLRLATGDDVRLSEVYPPDLPDLFHGSQLVVIGRYSGDGHIAVKLSGFVGGERKEFLYEVTFPGKTDAATGKDFVEPLWARRKVGFLLDQIRANGEKKELVDEVVSLAKRYGIATPYTSYLVVPDGPMPVVPPTRPSPGPRPRPIPLPGGIPGGPIAGGFGGSVPPGLAPPAEGRPGDAAAPASKPASVEAFAREQAAGAKKDAEARLYANRGLMTEKQVEESLKQLAAEPDADRRRDIAGELLKLKERKATFDEANMAFKGGRYGYQTGKLGVDLAVNTKDLRSQDKLTMTANCQANGRQVVEVGGVWIDDQFQADQETVVVKAQSEAYFRILERHPKMKDVFRLGNHLVWVAPNGCALVIDRDDGQEKLPDDAIDALFVAKK